MKKNAAKRLNKTAAAIQSASPQARMRWAVGLTALVTILVLALWVRSIDDLITTSTPGALLSVESPNQEEKGLIQKLKIRTAQTIVYFQRKFSEKNEISIEL